MKPLELVSIPDVAVSRLLVGCSGCGCNSSVQAPRTGRTAENDAEGCAAFCRLHGDDCDLAAVKRIHSV